MAERHRMIATLAASGMMKKEIAQRVGCHPNTVTRVLKNPLIREMVDEMQKTVQQETILNLVEAFNEAAPAAFMQLMKLMTSGPPSVSFRASESILDRSETAPPKRLRREDDGSPGGVTIQIGVQRMNLIKEALEDVGDYETIKLLEAEYAVQDSEIDAKIGDVLSERVEKI